MNNVNQHSEPHLAFFRMGEVDPGTVLCFPVHGRGTTTQCRPVVNRFTQIIHLRPPQPYQELVLLYFTSKEMALRGLVTCPNQTKRLASSGWRTSGIREPASLPTTLSVVRLGASCCVLPRPSPRRRNPRQHARRAETGLTSRPQRTSRGARNRERSAVC